MTCLNECQTCVDSTCDGCEFNHDRGKCKEAEKLKKQAGEMPCYHDATEGQL